MAHKKGNMVLMKVNMALMKGNMAPMKGNMALRQVKKGLDETLIIASFFCFTSLLLIFTHACDCCGFVCF